MTINRLLLSSVIYNRDIHIHIHIHTHTLFVAISNRLRFYGTQKERKKKKEGKMTPNADEINTVFVTI